MAHGLPQSVDPVIHSATSVRHAAVVARTMAVNLRRSPANGHRQLRERFSLGSPAEEGQRRPVSPCQPLGTVPQVCPRPPASPPSLWPPSPCLLCSRPSPCAPALPAARFVGWFLLCVCVCCVVFCGLRCARTHTPSHDDANSTTRTREGKEGGERARRRGRSCFDADRRWLTLCVFVTVTVPVTVHGLNSTMRCVSCWLGCKRTYCPSVRTWKNGNGTISSWLFDCCAAVRVRCLG
jgi:hypothetical protein